MTRWAGRFAALASAFIVGYVVCGVLLIAWAGRDATKNMVVMR